MPNIMHECKGFSEILVESQRKCHCSSDLRNLDGVGEPISEMIRQPRSKNLRFVFQPAKGPCMYDTVAVSLELVAVRMREFRVSATLALSDRKAQVREDVRRHGKFSG
jgi:hypothetical protein